MAERESAEEEYRLTVRIWAQGEESCDCHLGTDGELLKEVFKNRLRLVLFGLREQDFRRDAVSSR